MEKMNIGALFRKLDQDEKSDIRILELIKGGTSFYIAELKPGKKLPAHYHNEGSEIYHVLAGKGEIELGTLSGTEVVWQKHLDINPNDILEVKPRIVHRLANDGDENLKIVFIAPPSHLGDDRIFI